MSACCIIANEVRSSELAITSLISNKREWNNCFIKFLNSKNYPNSKSYEKYEIRARKSERIEKNSMKMRCCVVPSGQTDVGSSQKHFLTFRVLLNVDIDPNFPQKNFVFFFWLYSGENIFGLATLSAIIYHIRSN